MRYSILFAFILATSFIQAQNDADHQHSTIYNVNDYDHELLKQRLLANKAMIDAGIVYPRNTLYIPIRFHLSAMDDGSDRLSPNRVLDQLCELNEDFAPYNMQFYFKDGSFNYINDDDFHDNHLAVQTAVLQRQRDPDAVNVYVVNTIDFGDGGEGTILAYYSVPNDWIVMSDTYVRENDPTLTHEMGHFFSLLHTFNGYEPEPHNEPNVNAPVFSPGGVRTEFADGSNCDFSGDFLCDTPAEYNNGLGASRCELTANILDPRGEPIDPDERNYESYFLLCPDDEYRFSDDQVAIMNIDYNSGSRGYLRRNAPPAIEELGPVSTAIYPTSNGNSEFYDYIPFEWTPTSGATAYVFELSRVSNFQLITERLVVEDNRLLLTSEEVLPGRRYFWRVRPFNAHITCQTEFPNRNQFTTSEVSITTSTAELSTVNEFTIAPNPVIGTDDLILSLDAAEDFQAQLQFFNLSGQAVQTPRELQVQRGTQQFSLLLNDLPNGVYYLRLVSDVGQMTQKVIIAR